MNFFSIFVCNGFNLLKKSNFYLPNLLSGLLVIFLIINNCFAQDFTLVHDNVQRSYYLHVPSTYDGSKAVPLIICFHGLGEDRLTTETLTGLTSKSDSKGFIVVYPQGIATIPGIGSNGWNQDTIGLDDLGFTSDLIDTLSKNFNIDPNRIYATGFSIGAGFCYRIAQQFTDRIAAIAPVSPFIIHNYDLSIYSQPKCQIPLIQFKALNDSYADFSHVPDYWNNINNCKINPDTILNTSNAIGLKWNALLTQADQILYMPVNGGHNWFHSSDGIDATDAILDFFDKHTLVSSPLFTADVKITSLSEEQVIDIPANIKVTADVNSTQNNINKVEFYTNEVKIGEADAAPYEISFQNNTPGKFILAAKAINASGNVLNIIHPVTTRFIRHTIAANEPAFASSVKSKSIKPSMAFDKDFRTYWIGKLTDPQWICVKLDNITSINAVTLYWDKDFYATAYQLQVSTDSLDWQDIYSTIAGDGSADEILFEPVPARYVKLTCTKKSKSYSGNILYEFLVHTDIESSIKETGSELTPEQFTLNQNYPNPFNPVTVISYQLQVTGNVELSIYDIMGREVAVLVNEEKAAGSYEVKFDGSNLSSGIYFYRLMIQPDKFAIGNFTKTNKMVLMR